MLACESPLQPTSARPTTTVTQLLSEDAISANDRCEPGRPHTLASE